MRSATVHRLEAPAKPWGSRLTNATGTTFQDAMRQLPSGVCVVTLGTGRERAGLTATSVSPLSAEPPALLVCILRSSSSDAALARLDAFAVNVLTADQREIAGRFAGGADLKEEEGFEDGLWAPLPSGIPCLADSVAVFECEVEERIERRAHAIVIGRVRRVLMGRGSGALVSWRGGYDQVGWSSDEIVPRGRIVSVRPRLASSGYRAKLAVGAAFLASASP